MKLRPNANMAPLAATFLVTALLILFGGLRYTGFATTANLLSIVNDSAFIGIAAVGATLVILSGGIDLSIGAVIAFTSILTASLIERHGVNPAVAITLALAIGAASGALTGTLIHFFELPPFMVTLAAMFFWRAAAFMIEPQSLSIKNDAVLHLAEWGIHIGGARVPLLTLIYATVAAAGVVVAGYSGFGRNTYAIGGSEASAKLMGVPVGRTKVLLYTVAGLCSALAGVVAAVYKCSGDPAGFVGSELDAIAAVVIGGTLLTGGVGYVLGTALGVLILGLVQAVITFEGTLSAAWTKIAVGALVLTFILLQKAVVRLTHAKRRTPMTASAT